MKRGIQVWLICAVCLAACVRSLSSPSVVVSTLTNAITMPASTPIPTLIAGTATLDVTPNRSTSPVEASPTAAQLPLATQPATPTLPPGNQLEHPVVLIPLAGRINQLDSGITGLAWYSDTLILLPQFPDQFKNQGGGSVFLIQKADLLSFLDGESSGPIIPDEAPFFAPGIRERIPGLDGFQSIAFSGDRIFLTVAANPEEPVSYLLSGWYEPGLEAIYIDVDRRSAIEPQTQLPDLGDKSLVPFGRRLATIYAANGGTVNPIPKAHLFNQDLSLTTELDFPNIEFRISDATPPDDSGRFWIINIFTPSEALLQTGVDPLVEIYGEGQTHGASSYVERLIELQFSEQGIVLVDNAPIQLELAADGIGREWSALTLLDQRGFLLATNGTPQTLLAFVPLNP